MSPSPPETFAVYSERTAAEIAKRPRVVAHVSSSGLTAATAATTFYVSHKRRRYRVSAILFITTGGDAGTVALNVLHTDRVGAVTAVVVAATNNAAATRASAVYEFEADNASLIRWSTTLGGVRVLSVWAVEYVLEEMP